MRRFVSPYKKYIGWAVLLNILSAVFNGFGFEISLILFSAFRILSTRSIEARPFGMLYPAFAKSFNGLITLYKITI
jgi:ATP-binding cassette, subfamily B, bacterial MsbA